jgi:putative photosynthetic complex assembly protein
MAHEISNRLVSRPRVEGLPLIGLAILISGSLLLAGYSQWQKTQQPETQLVGWHAQRALVFSDGADGSVWVTDAQTGERLSPIEGEAGFARGVLRSLAQARLRAGGAPAEPFWLSANTLGGLTLSDPVSGRKVDLTSFGPSNLAVFALYLERREPVPVSRLDEQASGGEDPIKR